MLQTTHIDDIIKSAADIAFVEVLYILIYLLRERDVIEWAKSVYFKESL